MKYCSVAILLLILFLKDCWTLNFLQNIITIMCIHIFVINYK